MTIKDPKPIDLLSALEKHQTSGDNPASPPVKEEPTETNPALSLQKMVPLQNATFKLYLKSRGIPFGLAKKHLKEAHVLNVTTGVVFYAMAMGNESGGYELRNKFVQDCLASKDISFVRGTALKDKERGIADIHVFEGMMDFLSALALREVRQFKGDAIILNSLSCLSKAYPYIKNYGYKTLYSWLDNDEAGQKASAELKAFAASEQGLKFKPMNNVYEKHKNVNAWLVHKMKL